MGYKKYTVSGNNAGAPAHLSGVRNNGLFDTPHDDYKFGYMLRRIDFKRYEATDLNVILIDGDGDEYILFAETGLTPATVVIADMQIPVLPTERIKITTSAGVVVTGPKATIVVSSLADA